MPILDSIKGFPKQFTFEPKVENEGKLKKTDKFVVCGMGGSGLAAGLIKIYDPYLDLLIHKDYGLPRVPDYFLNEGLIILSSYSGNTEEVIDAYLKAGAMNLGRAVVAAGGKLLELAKKEGVPYVELPEAGIQPRMALGLSMRATLKLIGDEMALEESMKVSEFKSEDYEQEGKALAQKLEKKIPVIYASAVNFQLAYNWKIKLNESGKVPAFANAFPEVNHNEMTSFDLQGKTAPLSDHFSFIILKDSSDDPRMHKRMDAMAKIFSNLKLPVTILDLKGANVFQKTFSSLMLADWVAYHTAMLYGVEPEEVPMVEEFKRLIR